MEEFISILPEVIREASSSKLGFIVLFIIVLAGLIFSFFKTSSEKFKVFILLVFIVCFFFSFFLLNIKKNQNKDEIIDIKSNDIYESSLKNLINKGCILFQSSDSIYPIPYNELSKSLQKAYQDFWISNDYIYYGDFRIVGYTSPVGTNQYNIMKGLNRAKEAKKYLEDNFAFNELLYGDYEEGKNWNYL